MRTLPPRSRGFTLIELIVVLFIVGILVTAAANMYTSKQRPAVQALMDELEGVLTEVQKAQDLTPKNIQFSAAGTWLGGTLEIQAVDSTGQLITQKFMAKGHPNFAAACIAPDNSMIKTALGTVRPDLSTVPPGNTNPWNTALQTYLCDGTGAGTGVPTTPFAGGKTIQINAYNHQFVTNFCIPVVGLSQGHAYPGAPVGYVIVVGNRIYKFYSAGPNDSWRRL